MGLVTDRPADVAYRLHKAVVGHGDARPNGGHQLVLGYQPPGAFGQAAQDRECLRPQRDGRTRGVAQHLCTEIDDDAVQDERGNLAGQTQDPRKSAFRELYHGMRCVRHMKAE